MDPIGTVRIGALDIEDAVKEVTGLDVKWHNTESEMIESRPDQADAGSRARRLNREGSVDGQDDEGRDEWADELRIHNAGDRLVWGEHPD